MKILVLNAGSSSQKSRLYELKDALPDLPIAPLWEADGDSAEHPGVTKVKITTAQGQTLEEELQTDSRQDVIAHLLDTLWSGKTQVLAQPSEIDIVGHRVVHGGQEFHESTLITPAVKDAIKHLSAYAPLHNPINLEGIEAVERILPRVPQVAVFDTAFHSQLPMAALVYPGPYEWFEEGIRRYGFHGISHQYCAGRAAQILGRDLASLRLITCHIGNGCSLAAISGGRSIDTTMGFTPLEGAMMATLGGVDAIIFAEGVGEHAPSVRWAACKAFGFLGLKLDAAKNAQSPADQDIATADSSVRVLIVQTQEDWSIARECWKIASSKLPG